MALARAAALVVDASAFGEYLIGSDLGLEVATIIEAPDSRLNSPALCDVEVCSALRRVVTTGLVNGERATDALADYLALPIERHGHEGLLTRVFELRNNFTTSDATYVALSERLDATLVTCDARLTGAVKALLRLNVIGVSA